MSDVPEEICREILSRLPVAPLLRLRFVSKSWKRMIESDEFVKQHLDRSKKTNPKLNIILRSFGLHSADFDLLNHTNKATFKELTYPLKALSHRTDILGSCDGLLALTDAEDDDTILWNPSVRMFHEVPYTRIEYPEYFFGVEHIVYGFGYDVLSDDYKLVRMVQFYKDYRGNIETEVKVYSVKSDSWRRIIDFPYCLKYIRTHGELVNGALHWIVTLKVKRDTPNTKCLIAAFDLGTEEYRLVPLPEKFADEDDDININVAVLGGRLSLVHYDDERIDVWVMKEYGFQESWLHLFTVDVRDFAFTCDFTFMTLLGYSRCGRKVLVGLDDRVLMWYDLDTKFTDLSMDRTPMEDSPEMHTCLQSLVLLSGGTNDFDLLTKNKQERKGRRRSSTPRNDDLAKKRTVVFPTIGSPNGHQ